MSIDRDRYKPGVVFWGRRMLDGAGVMAMNSSDHPWCKGLISGISSHSVDYTFDSDGYCAVIPWENVARGAGVLDQPDDWDGVSAGDGECACPAHWCGIDHQLGCSKYNGG